MSDEAAGSQPEVEVTVVDRSEDDDLDGERWAAVAAETLVAEGIAVGELGLTFVGVDEMETLNLAHMGKEGPTDVLAFPIDGADLEGTSTSEVPVCLGDVVICPSVAKAQASEHCGTIEAELALLTIHGVLHVLGHDHYLDEERVLMQGREREHMKRYGFGHPEFTA